MKDGIAIVGLGCIFPGAPDVGAFWELVEQGRSAITDAPPSRLDRLFHDPGASEIDRLYVRRGGFLGDTVDFDAAAFGVMPVAAAGAEPDQMVALEAAAHAFADAGYDRRPFPRDRTGVILGRGGYLTPGMVRMVQKIRTANEVALLLRRLLPELDDATIARIKRRLQDRAGPLGPDTVIGLVPNLAASRIANRLDLHGAAYTVDAACASALLAVEHAVRALRSEQADLVLAGGIHLVHDVTFWSVFTQLGALSRSGSIRPYDARADGLLIGEGVGMLLLKRLRDAERDGDRIYAVIRGVGVASDGRASSVMQPRIEGQVLALERAWLDAELDPETVQLVEGHGTATPAGDAAELETLRRVFGHDPAHRAVLGSVKSNIGHAMPAAGAAGLIKTVLALHHGVLPPTLHCEEPAPALAQTRFRVLSSAEPWEAHAVRRAAVNAFGFGGIDAHVVLESHGAKERRRRRRPEDDPNARLLLLASASPAALLADLDVGRRGGSGPARLAVVDPSPARLARAREIVERGAPWQGRGGIYFSPRGLATQGGKIAFLYPGVDAVFEPRVEDVAERFDEALPPYLQADDLEEQGLAIVAVSRLLGRVLRRLGVRPHAVAGHSIGEWTAMIEANLIPQDEADAFIGTLRPGTLEVPGVLFAAAGCGIETAREAIADLDQIAVSHDNCPHQVILCGRDDRIEVARRRLVERGVLCQILPFRSGFHSPLFRDYVEPHRRHFRSLPLEPPEVPVWSATTCTPFPDDPSAVRELAIEHLVTPVRFRELILAMWEAGYRIFVQVGTGRLVGFVDDTLGERPHLAIAANLPRRPGMAQLRNLVAALWVEGVEVDLEPFTGTKAARGRPLALPLGAPLIDLADEPPLKTQVVSTRRATDRVVREFQETLDTIGRTQQEVMQAFEAWRGRQKGPRPHRSTRVLGVETVPELLDHSFFPQPPGWPVVSDRYPVVPMTMTVEMMIEAAEAAGSGQVVVAVSDLKAYKWLKVEPPVEVTIVTEPIDARRMKVCVEGYAEAVVELDARYPEPPLPTHRPLRDARPAAIRASELYSERWMFHGPAYHGVVELGGVGEEGIDGVLEVTAGPGALLDSAGQLFGYWVMDTRSTDRLAMPIGFERLERYGPPPKLGERLACTVRVTDIDQDHVTCDIEVSQGGRLWARILGWTDKRFESDVHLWSVLRRPEDTLLSEVREAYVLYDDRRHRAPSRDWLMRRYLGHREREEMLAAGPRRQRDYLHGRIAAKDAVRRWLWEEGAGPIFPVEVEIRTGPQGVPEVHGFPGRDLRVSIAHTENVAVALATEGRQVGIDVERIEARPSAFERAAFTDEELRLLDDSEGRIEWATRLWCAKEALAKALGSGLENPRSLAVSAIEGQRVRIGEHWIETRVDGEYAVAWVLL
ncbi:MAG: acyltransferase domain-containing protein [Deltaproteobacteria bacterium]|nr:MAG: acyltransferase domain-containing protein [Deltaproteobacteria bacterium]